MRALLSLTLTLGMTWLTLAPSAHAADRPRSLPEKTEAINEGLEPAPADVDRSTPSRAWALFTGACKSGAPRRAMHVLNLGDVPAGDRRTLAPVLATQLCSTLRVAGLLEATGLDDTPLGPVVDDHPANFVVTATLKLTGGDEELWLRRFHDTTTDAYLWLLTRQTVSKIPSWYQDLVTRDRVARPTLETLHQGLGPRPEKLTPVNPREALVTLSALCRQGRYQEAAFLLDLSGVAKEQQAVEGPRLARRFGLLVERLRPSGLSSVSNDAAGAPEQDVQVDEEVVARAVLPDQEVKVKLARFPRASGTPVWLVSGDTVAAIDDVYSHLGYGVAGDLLPSFFFAWRAWGVQLWQWLGLVVALLLSVFLGRTAAWLSRALLGRMAARTRWTWDDKLVEGSKGPLGFAFTLLAFLALTGLLALAEGPHQVVMTASKLTAILAGGWILMRVIDVSALALEQFFRARNDDLGTSMVPVFRKVLKPIAVVLVGVVALQNVGLNVAGLIAGLGIGGLAIALAGKSTLENLFGSLAIAFDRPFKIGEFVRVDTFVGTIEDVGLRSTRIRTLDRTLVSIPNAQMADSKVENYARRDRFRLYVTLGVEYGTTMEQVKLVLDDLKKLLLAHPKIWQEGFSVRFTGYAAYSLNLEVMCWLEAADWNEFTGLREQLLLDMGHIVESAGARFAFPSQTLYQAPADPADPKLAEQARAELERRTRDGVLCIPEIPTAVKEAAQAQREQAKKG